MKFIIAISFILISSLFYAQTDESIITDTVVQNHVKNALLLSTFIPGSGQVYNSIHSERGNRNAYWKVPLIYAGIGVTGYFLLNNQRTVSSLKREYLAREAGTDDLNTEWQPYDDSGVLTLYQQASNKRDLSILVFGLVYLFQLADAGVEAHFLNFDISEDLSVHVKPVLFNQHKMGMQLSFNFR
jgi:hypothetical protein